jgi:hypothetical protein
MIRLRKKETGFREIKSRNFSLAIRTNPPRHVISNSGERCGFRHEDTAGCRDIRRFEFGTKQYTRVLKLVRH